MGLCEILNEIEKEHIKFIEEKLKKEDSCLYIKNISFNEDGLVKNFTFERRFK